MVVIVCGTYTFPFHETYTTRTSHQRHVSQRWSLTLITNGHSKTGPLDTGLEHTVHLLLDKGQKSE